MTMLKQILVNEVTDILGRTPDKEEFRVFMDVISDVWSDRNGKIFLVNIEEAFRDCLKENFWQCEECGEWYLMRSDEWNEDIGGHVCRNCHPYNDPDTLADFQNDLAREGD